MDYTEQLTLIAESLQKISNDDKVSTSITELTNVIGLLLAQVTLLTNVVSLIKDDINSLKDLGSTTGIISRPHNADVQSALLRMTLADGNQIERFKLAKEEYKIDPVV